MIYSNFVFLPLEAHCLADGFFPPEVIVNYSSFVGQTYDKNYSYPRQSAEIIVHPHYNNNTHENDIALFFGMHQVLESLP
jgi:hypothetical protein